MRQLLSLLPPPSTSFVLFPPFFPPFFTRLITYFIYVWTPALSFLPSADERRELFDSSRQEPSPTGSYRYDDDQQPADSIGESRWVREHV
ncbi:hypothetical protein PM082_004122 [Marasmius tenuissimus]|nr:hypothetical protein PM082_004122 [Marasmius tenuissimus]